MNDLERDLRDLLAEDARRVATPTEAPAGLRRQTRVRQLVSASAMGLVFSALVAVGFWALSSLPSRDAGVPAARPTTQTINGITITFPEGWHLVDPDEAGLNGPDPTADLPRLVLALSPQPPNEMLACPGLVEGTPPTFLMTVQELPFALAGDGSAPWPVTLEPTGGDAAGSGCYPAWEFLRASWTSQGRTFEAVVGLAPGVTDGDSDALLAAFSSMTFEPAVEPVASVVLATGTAGSEDWELIATREDAALSLTLQGESFGTGTGDYDPTSDELRLTSHVFGDGAGSERVVFAAVPAEVVLLVGTGPTFTEYPEILDVPDAIDRRLNAFVLVVDADTDIAFQGFSATDDLIVSGGLDAEGKPLVRPSIEADEVLFDGRTNECWWTLTRTSVGADTERLQLASPLGALLAEVVADVAPDAPPLQAAAFECPSGGTLTFGVATSDVDEILWTSASGATLRADVDCIASSLPEPVCVFVSDHIDVARGGEARALDAGGNEIGRVTFD